MGLPPCLRTSDGKVHYASSAAECRMFSEIIFHFLHLHAVWKGNISMHPLAFHAERRTLPSWGCRDSMARTLAVNASSAKGFTINSMRRLRKDGSRAKSSA